MSVQLRCAVEGITDEAVVLRILKHVGIDLVKVYGKGGKQSLLSSLAGYNQSAYQLPWLVLIDLDRESCVVSARNAWLANPAPHMCFRIAVREVEAWLLADRDRIAAWLGLAVAVVPLEPEKLADPKQTLIGLAQKSPIRSIRAGLAPTAGNQSSSPGYSRLIASFVSDEASGWRPDIAAQHAPSLARCLACLTKLASGGKVS